LAEVDTVAGNITEWDPAVDGQVNTAAMQGDTLYVGGYFQTIGGRPQA
jgi:hypothetical protein